MDYNALCVILHETKEKVMSIQSSITYIPQVLKETKLPVLSMLNRKGPPVVGILCYARFLCLYSESPDYSVGTAYLRLDGDLILFDGVVELKNA